MFTFPHSARRRRSLITAPRPIRLGELEHLDGKGTRRAVNEGRRAEEEIGRVESRVGEAARTRVARVQREKERKDGEAENRDRSRERERERERAGSRNGSVGQRTESAGQERSAQLRIVS